LGSQSRSEITPPQDLIRHGAKALARIVSHRWPQRLRKSRVRRPRKSIPASMSQLTQRWQHSPNRRIKSMSFIDVRNIKVIGFVTSEYCKGKTVPPLPVNPESRGLSLFTE
jgi:hypothetical protein